MLELRFIFSRVCGGEGVNICSILISQKIILNTNKDTVTHPFVVLRL